MDDTFKVMQSIAIYKGSIPVVNRMLTFHHERGAIKIHTLMDLRGSIPTFVHLTEGAVHDSKIMDKIPVEANSYYLMDKGYVKFDSLFRHFHLNNAFFVTRAKENMLYEVLDSREVDQSAGLFSDETIKLTGPLTSKKYPDSLRLVVYEDFSTNTVYRFLTNNFKLEALTIAELYRERWQIELFFYDKHIIMQSEVDFLCITD